MALFQTVRIHSRTSERDFTPADSRLVFAIFGALANRIESQMAGL